MDKYEEICKNFENLILEIRSKEYADEFKAGYIFGTNVYEDRVKEYGENYRKKGYDIIVKDAAFNCVGQKLNLYRAVLIRKIIS